MELILLPNGAGAVRHQQRAGAHQQEDKDSNGGCQGIVVAIDGELIEPSDQKIGFTRLEALLILVQIVQEVYRETKDMNIRAWLLERADGGKI